jgi:putative ABC transport system permease protein
LVSLAGTIAIATWLASLDASLDAAFDTVFARIDLMVSAGADPFAVEATRMPAAIFEEMTRLPEVAFVDPIRINTVGFDGSLIAIVAGDAQLYAHGQRRLHMIDGDAAAAATALVSGPAVVVNQTFASRFHRRRGDTLDLATPNGPLRVRIAGIYLELSPGDLATIHLDRALYRRHWRDDTASILAVSLKPGSDRRRVADTLRARWGSRRLVVFTLEQLRREYRAMLSHLSALVYPLVSTSIVVAVIGIISARIASMMMRVRVSGVLRAVGATRAQVTRMFGFEAAGIGVAATALAAVVGSVLGRLEIVILMRGMLGMSVLYAYPRAVASVAGIGLVLLTTGAGWVLGRWAGAAPVSDALRWE